MAGDELVRRTHSLQGGRSRQVGRCERRDLLRLGTLRLSLDHPLPQHRGDAHGVRQRAARDASLPAPGSVAGLATGPACIRGTDHLPQSVARRLVARPRHRRAAEDSRHRGIGHRGTQQDNRPPECVPKGQTANGARGGRIAGGVRDPGGATRCPHRNEDGEQAPRPGHRGAAGHPRLHPRRTSVRRRHVRGVDGSTEAGAHPLAPGADLLS